MPHPAGCGQRPPPSAVPDRARSKNPPSAASRPVGSAWKNPPCPARGTCQRTEVGTWSASASSIAAGVSPSSAPERKSSGRGAMRPIASTGRTASTSTPERRKTRRGHQRRFGRGSAESGDGARLAATATPGRAPRREPAGRRRRSAPRSRLRPRSRRARRGRDRRPAGSGQRGEPLRRPRAPGLPSWPAAPRSHRSRGSRTEAPSDRGEGGGPPRGGARSGWRRGRAPAPPPSPCVPGANQPRSTSPSSVRNSAGSSPGSDRRPSARSASVGRRRGGWRSCQRRGDGAPGHPRDEEPNGERGHPSCSTAERTTQGGGALSDCRGR